MQLERVERSNPLDTNPEGTWRYLTLNFEDLNQVQHYGQIPHARGKLSSNYTPLNNYATPHESIRRFHRLSGYVNAIDSQQVYLVAIQLTKQTRQTYNILTNATMNTRSTPWRSRAIYVQAKSQALWCSK